MKPERRGCRAHGLSLVELMVALALSLAVVGALWQVYLTTGVAGRQQAAWAQMTEDAQIGLALLTRELTLAGYAVPAGVETAADGSVRLLTAPPQAAPVLGCDPGFAHPAVAPGHACSVGWTSSAIEINYDADAAHSVLHSSGVPTDCLGVALTAQAGPGGAPRYPARHLYYVSPSVSGAPELHCAGVTGSGQPLLENVEQMQLRYGEASAVDPLQIERFVAAADVADWHRVRGVRICLLMRSGLPVLGAEDAHAYLDCEGVSRASADRRARRAYVATVALRNRSRP